jgi:hypothetical protein
MFTLKTLLPSVVKALGVCAVCLLGAGEAHAALYSFGNFLSGGGGGQDPAKQKVARGMGAYVCVDVSPGPASMPNTVQFTVWSKMPEPKARITTIAVDVGRHSNLFRNIAVTMGSPGVKAQVVPAQSHPFLPRIAPEYWISIAQRGHLNPDGLSTGRMVVFTGTLNAGKAVTDVFSALQEGLNPATAPNGLRLGVIALWLLGGPPPGIATIQDDGGFGMTVATAACR